MRKAAGAGYSTATDLADWLVREVGLPFREAHHATGRAVALAESRSANLPIFRLKIFSHQPGNHRCGVFDVLTVDASVAAARVLAAQHPMVCAPRSPLAAEALITRQLQGCISRRKQVRKPSRGTPARIWQGTHNDERCSD
jgi:hypothetical protein